MTFGFSLEKRPYIEYAARARVNWATRRELAFPYEGTRHLLSSLYPPSLPPTLHTRRTIKFQRAIVIGSLVFSPIAAVRLTSRKVFLVTCAIYGTSAIFLAPTGGPCGPSEILSRTTSLYRNSLSLASARISVFRKTVRYTCAGAPRKLISHARSLRPAWIRPRFPGVERNLVTGSTNSNRDLPSQPS